MDVSTHHEYLNHLQQRLLPLLEQPAVTAKLELYAYEFVTVTELNLDPQREALEALYCPTGQGAPKDPICMLRSLLLMTLRHETSSPDAWATRLKGDDLLALLAGFEPGHTPCGTALRDFVIRYGDGPYALRTKQDTPLSQTLCGQHERRLSDTTKARQAEADRLGLSQSEALCRRLLDEAKTPRDPQALQTRLDDMLVQLGLRPSIEAHLFGDAAPTLVVEGDGTPLKTAASPRGTRTCTCPPGSKNCDHPRLYTSGTAQWCHHPSRGWVFGDESYTISAHVNGRDIPLMSIMGTGNESDFTLGPKALDELLKVIQEHDLPLDLDIFIGDGHHDTLPFYRYCRVKGIRTIIPLNGDAVDDPKKTFRRGKNRVSNTYPGSISCQVMAVCDPAAGLYMASHDPDGHGKTFTVEAGFHHELSIAHLAPYVEGADLRVPYPILIGTFTGDPKRGGTSWYDTAKIYRHWSQQQEWAKLKVRTREGEVFLLRFNALFDAWAIVLPGDETGIDR